MPSDPITGIITRRHAALPTGYIRIPSRSVNRMKATTASPVSAPTSSASARSSRV